MTTLYCQANRFEFTPTSHIGSQLEKVELKHFYSPVKEGKFLLIILDCVRAQAHCRVTNSAVTVHIYHKQWNEAEKRLSSSLLKDRTKGPINSSFMAQASKNASSLSKTYG